MAARFGETNYNAAIAIGRAARARGYYTRQEFMTVCAWKTPRSKPKVATNSPSDVRAATSQAFAAKDLAEQIAYLINLNGVGFPTASVLLHIAFPNKFPILDVRALESLGVAKRNYTPAFWADYVKVCRTLAADNGISLRTLDKALWQHSKEAHR